MPRSYTVWTDEIKERQFTLVKKYSGLIKSKETMKDKWKVVLEKLKLTHSKVSVNIVFKFDLTDYWLKLKSMGFSQEGANLSALREDNTQVQKLTMSLTIEIYSEKEHSLIKKAAKEKKKNLQLNLLTHKNYALIAQGSHHSSDVTVESIDCNLKILKIL